MQCALYDDIQELPGAVHEHMDMRVVRYAQTYSIELDPHMRV